jgi:hypothetical protein
MEGSYRNRVRGRELVRLSQVKSRKALVDTLKNLRFRKRQRISCRIWGFHSGGFEEYLLLGYDAE